MTNEKGRPGKDGQTNQQIKPTNLPSWIQDKLSSSAIPLHIAEDAGIRFVRAEEAARLLGRDFRKKPNPDAFEIPYRTLDGAPILDGGTPYFRLRFHGEGLETKDGKHQKYTQLPKTEPHVYIPPGLLKALRKFPVLTITEGELKALCATEHGIPTDSLGGIQSWSDPEARFFEKQRASANGLPTPRLDHESPIHSELWPIIEAAKRSGIRKVLVLGDSDGNLERDACGQVINGNRSVESAVKKLAKALQWQGGNIEVYWGFCPNPEAEEGEPVPTEKWGLDDWIVAKGEMAVKSTILNMTASKFKRAISFSEREHLPLAEWFRTKFQANGTPGLVCWREDFYQWGGQFWQKVEDRPLQAELHRWLESFAIYDKKDGCVHPTRALLESVWATLQRISHLPTSLDAPFRLTEPPQALPKGRVVVLQNGILDLNTRELCPATPELFCPNPLPFSYHPGATCPEWERFLSSLWPDSPESIRLLKQWIGYLISGDTSYQKILFLIGPRRSGKGTILRVLTDLIGPENVTSALLTGLGGDFGLANLAGRSVGFFPDARLTGQADQGPIIERLLSISGEDALLVNRKYKDALSMRIPARLILVSNEVPRLTDASGALVSRLLILRMMETFYGREDHGLSDRLIKEMPGIFDWGLAGLDDLTASGYFTEPETSKGIRDDAERLASPVLAFVRDCCLTGPNYRVQKTDLYGAWKQWAEEAGHHAGSDAMFSRNLQAAFVTISSYRPDKESDSGTRPTYWKGLGLTVRDRFEESRQSCQPARQAGDHPESGLRQGPSSPSVIFGKVSFEENQKRDTPISYRENNRENRLTWLTEQHQSQSYLDGCLTEQHQSQSSENQNLPVEDI